MEFTNEDITKLLVDLQPDADALLDWLYPLIDDSMLQEIAEADGYGYAKHLAALFRIRNERCIPVPLEFVPGEALELVRWYQPNDADVTSGPSGERGHLIRAFACAVLLHAEYDPDTEPCNSAVDSTARLVESSMFLGDDAARAALSLLSWCIQNAPPFDDERGFLIYGMLLLSCALVEDTITADTIVPNTIGRLYEWVMVEEQTMRDDGAIPPITGSSRWLLGLTPHDLSHCEWVLLSKRFLVDEPINQPAEIRDKLLLLGTRIIEGR